MKQVLMRLGEDLMEYALLIALFAFVVALGLKSIGTALNFDKLVTSLIGLAGSVFHWATIH